jgi:hypothetical protein
MSLAIDIEIELMDMAVRQCTQALIGCGATSCFINIEWAQSNNVPTCHLTNLIPVYNVDDTTNEAGMTVEIADVIHTMTNHNPEIDWQTKDIKMFCCPKHCSTCCIKTKCNAIPHKAKISQINACQAGAFPSMIEEPDNQDEATHVNTNETDEEVQGECPAFDDDLDFDADIIEIEEGDNGFMAMVHLVDPQYFVCALSTVSICLAKAFTKNSIPKAYSHSTSLLSRCVQQNSFRHSPSMSKMGPHHQTRIQAITHLSEHLSDNSD